MLFHLIIDGEGDIMIHFFLNLITEMGILQRPSNKMYDSSQNNEKSLEKYSCFNYRDRVSYQKMVKKGT